MNRGGGNGGGSKFCNGCCECMFCLSGERRLGGARVVGGDVVAEER